MGSSVSVPRSLHSAVKQRSSTSSDPHDLFISSPIKPKTLNSEDPVAEFGSVESFFDSQAWLESDCDDDFVSDNGDFTISSSNTPMHLISPTNPQRSKSQFIDRAPELGTEPSLASPTDNKKRLSEFLEECLPGEEVIHDVQTTPGRKHKDELDMSPVHLPKSTNGISYPFPFLSKSYSVRSRDRTPNRYPKPEKEKKKPTRTAGCCLPSLVTSLSFNEKRKRW